MSASDSSRGKNLVTPHIRRARVATFIGFMLMGAMLYVWSTGVSSFRARVGLNGADGDVEFGLITLALGCGGTIGCFIIGKFIDQWGAKKVVGAATIMYPLSIIPLGYVNSFYPAIAFASLYGFLRGAIDTALNTHGVQVERFYQRSIMSAFHAFFSFGGFLVGMIGSWLVGLNPDNPALAFTVLGGLMFIVGLVIRGWMLEKDDVPPQPRSEYKEIVRTKEAGHSPRRFAIILLMLGFGVVLLGGMVSEGAMWDWGQEYVRRELNTTASLAGVAVSVFIGAECVGRLIGDWLAEKLGSPQMVFASGVVSIIGLLLIASSHNMALTMVGLALTGLGLSCITPLMLSSAGRKDPENSGRNIGIVNCIGYAGMLVGPATITSIVGTFGLSVMMYFPVALMLLLTIFGPILMRDNKKDKTRTYINAEN